MEKATNAISKKLDHYVRLEKFVEQAYRILITNDSQITRKEIRAAAIRLMNKGRITL